MEALIAIATDTKSCGKQRSGLSETTLYCPRNYEWPTSFRHLRSVFGRVTTVELRQNTAVCMLGHQTSLMLSRFLDFRVAIDDEIALEFPPKVKAVQKS